MMKRLFPVFVGIAVGGAIVITGLTAVNHGEQPVANPGSNTQPAPAVSASRDAFGVPPGFQPSYKLVSDENIDLGATWTRRNVRIIVPAGLSATDVESNTRAAAEAAYGQDGQPNGITVFAYKPNTDTTSAYTAGRLIWAPGGDWMRCGESVSVADHAATFDLSELYSNAPTGLAAQMAKAAANADADGKKEERPLLRHFSERRLRSIYYTIEKGIYAELSSPSVPGNVDASMKANKAWVCHKMHITPSEYDVIRDVGDERNWPEPS